MPSNPFFSYSNRDYENQRKEGLSKIPQYSNGQWTDLSAGDIGVTLLDYIAALHDQLAYYLDHQALEMFVSTSKERKNLMRIAEQVCYKPRSAKGATVDIAFYVDGQEDSTYNKYPLTIDQSRMPVISSSAGYRFYANSGVTIETSDTPAIASYTQGIRTSETYVGSGMADQVFEMDGRYVDAGTIVITDNTGYVWQEVDYLAFVLNSDKVYQVIVNADYSVSIKFGNGTRGYAPTQSDKLTVSYIKVEGEEGQVKIPGEISGSFIPEATATSIRSVTVKYYNQDQSSGGSKGESDSDLRRNIQTATKTLMRAVTENDFYALAKTIDGVGKVSVYTVRNAPELCLAHEVRIIITGDDGRPAPESLITNVQDFLRDRSAPPTNVIVSGPSRVLLPVSVTIRENPLQSSSEQSATDVVKNIVMNYLNSLTVGESFNPYELTSLIKESNYVQKVFEISPSVETEIDKTSVFYATQNSITVVTR